MDSKKKLILDMDADGDNLLALHSAIKSAELSLLGVTTVHGYESAAWAATKVSVFLAEAGSDIPVIPGAESPWMRAKMLQDAAPVPAEAACGEGWRWMREHLARSEEKVTICLLGAATNLALLLKHSPEMAEKIEEIVFAGGSYGFGTITASACHKVYFDAEAMQVVMHTGIPFCMVSIDVTSGVPGGVETEALLASWRDETWERLLPLVHTERNANRYVRAPYAILTLTHPELFHYRKCKCEVELHGRITYGMTVVYLNDFDGVFELSDGTSERRDVAEKDKNILYLEPFDHAMADSLLYSQLKHFR